MQLQLPELEPHCGSWVIVRRDNGEAVCEIQRSSRRLAEHFRADRVVAVTAAQWLGGLNRSIAMGDTP